MRTCLRQHDTSNDGDTARLCGKEGNPLCKEHQFVADVLAETESVTREICEQRETSVTAWQAQLLRLRLLVGHADELTPAAFVKALHEALPDLHSAAMEATFYTYIVSRRMED